MFGKSIRASNFHPTPCLSPMLKKKLQKCILYGDFIIWARRKHITSHSPYLCNGCKYVNRITARCEADECGQIESYYCLCQTSGKYRYQPYDIKEV